MDNETDTKCDYVLSESQLQVIETFSWLLEVFAYIIVGIIGLMLNLIAMWVLLKPNMWNNFFNRILMCLSAYDSCFILCGLLEIIRRKWEFSSIQPKLFAHFLYPFRSMAMCSSIYTTLVLTLERYQAITSPIQYRIRNANTILSKRLCIYIVPVMLFSFVYYFPKFFDLYVIEATECDNTNHSTISNVSKAVKIDEDDQECQIKYQILPTELRINHQYIFWYLNVSNLIVTCVLPIGLLIFMNCRIATSLSEYRQRQPSVYNKEKGSTNHNSKTNQKATSTDLKQTFMLFSIVILFVICHALRIIMNISEFLNLEKLSIERKKGCDGISFWQHISMPLSEFLLIFNSSTHFFVYVFFDKSFQQVLKDSYATFKEKFKGSNELVQVNGQRLIGPGARKDDEPLDIEMEMNEVRPEASIHPQTEKTEISIEPNNQNTIS